MNFPTYLQDSVKVCHNNHSTLWPTPEQARKAKCPRCFPNRAKEPTPRQLDPEPWATGYGGQRAKESRQRNIERSREARRAAS